MIFIPFAIFFGLFLLSYFRERRRLRCGVLLVVSMALLALALGTVEAFVEDLFPGSPFFAFVHRIAPYLLSIIGLLPTAMVLLTLACGLMEIHREGIHKRSSFAVIFSLLVIAYVFLWPLVGKISTSGISVLIYLYITGILVYTILIKSVLTLTSEINLRHLPGDHHLRYVLVLGRPLKTERIRDLVRQRVDVGIRVYRENPGSKLILSGGWRVGRTEPESRFMAEYAREQGVPAEDVLEENQGNSTAAMIRNGVALMKADSGWREGIGEKLPPFALATTAYHVLRSLIIARKMRIPCIGYGARAKLSVSMNAFVREYVQYMKLTRKGHMILLAVYTAVFVVDGTWLMTSGTMEAIINIGK